MSENYLNESRKMFLDEVNNMISNNLVSFDEAIYWYKMLELLIFEPEYDSKPKYNLINTIVAGITNVIINANASINREDIDGKVLHIGLKEAITLSMILRAYRRIEHHLNTSSVILRFNECIEAIELCCEYTQQTKEEYYDEIIKDLIKNIKKSTPRIIKDVTQEYLIKIGEEIGEENSYIDRFKKINGYTLLSAGPGIYDYTDIFIDTDLSKLTPIVVVPHKLFTHYYDKTKKMFFFVSYQKVIYGIEAQHIINVIKAEKRLKQQERSSEGKLVPKVLSFQEFEVIFKDLLTAYSDTQDKPS